jgi:hypothetical protein
VVRQRVLDLQGARTRWQRGLDSRGDPGLVRQLPNLLRVGKKKVQVHSDLTGNNVAHARIYYGRALSYLEEFGFWLNREREQDRKTSVVVRGAAIAMGTLKPGLDYYRAISDGEQEALLKKAVQEAARRQQNG